MSLTFQRRAEVPLTAEGKRWPATPGVCLMLMLRNHGVGRVEALHHVCAVQFLWLRQLAGPGVDSLTKASMQSSSGSPFCLKMLSSFSASWIREGMADINLGQVSPQISGSAWPLR